MQHATLAQAGGSVLGVVTTTASTVSNIFSTIGGATDMLNKYVNDAKAKQSMASKVSMSDYQERLIEDKSIENAERTKLINEKLNADPLLEAAFNEHKARIKALFAEPTA